MLISTDWMRGAILTIDNDIDVFNALSKLREGLDVFLTDVCRTHDWTSILAERDVHRGVTGKVYARDTQSCLRMLTEQLSVSHTIRQRLGRDRIALASELREVRNKSSHADPENAFSDQDAYRALDSIERLLAAVGAHSLASEVQTMRLTTLMRLVVKEGGTPSEGRPSIVLPPRKTDTVQDLHSGREGDKRSALDVLIRDVTVQRVWSDGARPVEGGEVLLEYLRSPMDNEYDFDSSDGDEYGSEEIKFRADVLLGLLPFIRSSVGTQEPLSGIDIRGVDLSGADLAGVTFPSNSKLDYIRFCGANLKSCVIKPNSLLLDVDFSNADLTGAVIDTSMSRCIFRNAVLYRSAISGYLSDLDFSRANLRYARLTYEIQDCTFEGADLECAEIVAGDGIMRCNFSRARCLSTAMKFFEIKDCNFEMADMRDADLGYAFGNVHQFSNLQRMQAKFDYFNRPVSDE
jgi:uncharacterized protein YjbI with pentapeptide repeats